MKRCKKGVKKKTEMKSTRTKEKQIVKHPGVRYPFRTLHTHIRNKSKKNEQMKEKERDNRVESTKEGNLK